LSREKISNGEKSIKKSRKKISGEAYDKKNKQTVYIAPKSKIESRAQNVPEPFNSVMSNIAPRVSKQTGIKKAKLQTAGIK